MASAAPSGESQRDGTAGRLVTCAENRLMVDRSFPVLASQTLTIPSASAVTSVVPSAENTAAVTARRAP